MRDLNRRDGKTVAMVIHDLDLALRYSDRLVVMERGRVTAEGSAEEVLAELAGALAGRERTGVAALHLHAPRRRAQQTAGELHERGPSARRRRR